MPGSGPICCAGFSFNGTATLEADTDGIRYFVNEYWTSGQRQAHNLHEISYRACFSLLRNCRRSSSKAADPSRATLYGA